MIKIVRLLCIFLALIFLKITVVDYVFAEDIRVGIILPLTGRLSKFGDIEQNSFLMALGEINKAGGINGKKVDLIIKDTTGNPDVARLAINKLISEDEVYVLVGAYSSSVAWAAAPVAQQRKIPFLVNTASADRITEQGWDYIFRLNPPASEYPRALASFLTEEARIKTVAILHENTLFGQSGSRKFARQCEKELGLKVVIKESYERGSLDFEPLLLKVKTRKPDLIYMISHIMDASFLMQQAKELNLNPKMFVGGATGFTLPEFQEYTGDASEWVFSSTLWTPSVIYPGANSYAKKFLAKYNLPAEYHGAQAYAAMYVIADALRRATSLTQKAVRDSLAETDMMTVFGPVKFVSYGKKTQQNKLPTLLGQWINGRFEAVWPGEIATVTYLYPVPRWNER